MNSKTVSTWCIISMASIPLVMTLGNSMLIPVLPIFENEMNISAFQSSMIITSYSIAAILLIPIAGYLSDQFGRKRVIIPSLILTLIGGLIAGFASLKMDNPFFMVIIGRILQGIGTAGASPIVLPLVGDLYNDDDENASSCLGIIETSNTFGKVLSPIVGAAFATLIWFLPFFAISVFSFISLIMVFFFIKVPKNQDKPDPFKEFLKRTKTIFQNEGKWLYIVFIIGAYIMLTLFGILFYLSEILEKQHDIAGIKKGIILALPLLVLCFASLLTGKKIKGNLHVMKYIIMASLILMATFTPFIGFFEDNVRVLLLMTGFIGLAIGAMLPSLDAMITENIEKRERGTITSLYSSSRFIGVAAGPPIMSILMESYIHLGYILAGILGIAIFILVIIVIKPEKQST
ncbi:MFS transporter [Tenuibacillus multivorans]|uniref:MFS transporter, ACDE family, multidrug resistance protein n=1 Tax=Tenuibacillus multivorans TaxID=237069 RepID=A0A1H0DCI5_9BACI|nr:MFS transporter [Tenuibacillus multivorans]GEL76614.1 multidrug resistance protein [Tenuibacillus multivorans]SDN67686.1 MFS transporter, ACDE family, multidrug resistance protein [Tenuibacillus multivorans]